MWHRCQVSTHIHKCARVGFAFPIAHCSLLPACFLRKNPSPAIFFHSQSAEPSGNLSLECVVSGLQDHGIATAKCVIVYSLSVLQDASSKYGVPALFKHSDLGVTARSVCD